MQRTTVILLNNMYTFSGKLQTFETILQLVCFVSFAVLLAWTVSSEGSFSSVSFIETDKSWQAWILEAYCQPIPSKYKASSVRFGIKYDFHINIWMQWVMSQQSPCVLISENKASKRAPTVTSKIQFNMQRSTMWSKSYLFHPFHSFCHDPFHCSLPFLLLLILSSIKPPHPCLLVMESSKPSRGNCQVCRQKGDVHLHRP